MGVVKADGVAAAHLCKDESMVGVSRVGERKKMSGCKRDTLRRDALERTDSSGVWASDFMQAWPGAVETGVGVGRR